MKLLRRLFGVSWKTHQAEQRQSAAIIESLQDKVSTETKLRMRHENRYNAEREAHNKCAKARQELQAERETLMDINRGLARELRRIRELFPLVFTSRQAKDLILQHRTVELRHLRALTRGGKGNKFTAKHVALALSLAKKQAEDEAAAEHAETGD